MTEVFLLTIDSLRKDHFTEDHFSSCWGTFEKEFSMFENAFANGVATPFSFPAIITSYPVISDGTLQDDHPTIAEKYDGYSWAVTNNPHLRKGRGYHRGFDFFSDDLNTVSADNSATGLVQTVKRIGGRFDIIKRGYKSLRHQFGVDFIPKTGTANNVTKQLRSKMSEHEGLFWGHFMDPHYPFRPDKVLNKDIGLSHTYSEVSEMNNRFKKGNPSGSDIEVLQYLYSETIGYLDQVLSKFFDHLKQEGRWEDSIVVIMSDHGEAFGEEGVYNHMWDATPIDPLIEVPLLVKFPDCTGRRYEHIVQNADLFATLASELQWDVETSALTANLKKEGPRTIVSKSNTAVRITTENGYCIRDRDGSMEMIGNIADDKLSVLNSESIPEIAKLGEDDRSEREMDNGEQEKLEDRLEHLGYK